MAFYGWLHGLSAPCPLRIHQGGVDDNGAATVRALMHWQYRTISWEKTSILYRLNLLLGPRTQDYILFCGLRSYGRLFDGGPIATSQVQF